MPNFSSLAGLEVPEKFVVGWGGGVGWGTRGYCVQPNEVALRVALS